jgi:hypothetical protein
MRAKASVSIILLLLAATAVGAKDKSPPDPVTLPAGLAGAPAETIGTVVGTLGYRTDNKPYVGSAALVFRRAGAIDIGAIQYLRSTATLRGDTQTLDNKKGEFHYAAFSMALPEGQYELIGVVANYGIMSGGAAIAAAEGLKTVKFGMAGLIAGSVGASIGNEICSAGSTSDVTVSDGFSVPFEVKRGRVLYLGSFLAHGTLDHGRACFIPMPMPSKVYVSYADKWDRDRIAFPTVDASTVDHAILAVNERTGYYVIAEDHVVEAKWKMKDYSAGRMNLAGKIAEYQVAHPVAVQPSTAAVAASTPADPTAAASATVIAPAEAPAANDSTVTPSALHQ